MPKSETREAEDVSEKKKKRKTKKVISIKKEKRKPKEIKEKVKDDKNISEYDIDELRYVQTPIGKAVFKADKPEKVKTKPSDRVICDVCGKEFTRSGRTTHNRTQFHKLHASMNAKIKKLLIDN